MISAHGPLPGCVLDTASRLGVPYTETLHGMHDLFGADWQAEAARAAKMSAIVSVSELVRLQYLAGNPGFPAARIVTIPNGVDAERRRIGDRAGARERLGLRGGYLFVSLARVDTHYYSPSLADGPSGGGGVVAVGGDSRRDYATLIAAARMSGIPLTLVCFPRNIAGLDLPAAVTLRSNIPHGEYRSLLHTADLVVTPTVAPAYPSGQSVVLEAMSMGRATLTTDSAAMREYVTDGVDGVLVPASDPAEMARLPRARRPPGCPVPGSHWHMPPGSPGKTPPGAGSAPAAGTSSGTGPPAPVRPSADTEITLGYTLTGQRREVGFDRVLHPEITLMPAD